MKPLELAPRSLLVVMAHPDDAEFFAGGWIARVIASGTVAHLLLLTDGQGGSMDGTVSRQDLAATRRREQTAAAELLGFASVTFLGGEDGQLYDTWPLRLAVARAIRSTRPDVLLTTDPQHFYSEHWIHHPDHRAAGAIALSAAMPIANVRLAAPELGDLEPHTISDALLVGTSSPTAYAPLDEQHIAAKIAALQAHRSQMAHLDVDGFVRRRAEQAADQARHGGPTATYAETFVHVALRT